MMRVVFWASDDANSGVFMRCQDPGKITDENFYEANIFDQRPDPTYSTGAIVKVAPVTNGQKTVDIRNSKLASGPFALQWGRGTVKFRNEIKPL